MTTPIPARFAPPPSDHLGIAHPRPVCQVCDRAVATAEAAPTELAYRNDPRAALRVCDDVDCRRVAARIVPAVVAALDALAMTPTPVQRLETAAHPAARGGR